MRSSLLVTDVGEPSPLRAPPFLGLAIVCYISKLGKQKPVCEPGSSFPPRFLLLTPARVPVPSLLPCFWSECFTMATEYNWKSLWVSFCIFEMFAGHMWLAVTTVASVTIRFHPSSRSALLSGTGSSGPARSHTEAGWPWEPSGEMACVPG